LNLILLMLHLHPNRPFMSTGSMRMRPPIILVKNSKW
jgi:hypothetical protein